jgi:hypothetical protein
MCPKNSMAANSGRWPTAIVSFQSSLWVKFDDRKVPTPRSRAHQSALPRRAISTLCENEKVKSALPTTSFRGGIHVRRPIGGVGAPIGGYLDVDSERVRLHGLGFDFNFVRHDVKFIRFSPGILATRVSFVLLSPNDSRFAWFSTRQSRKLRLALESRSWPIINEKSFGLGIADELS